jgi:hypothetical protein
MSLRRCPYCEEFFTPSLYHPEQMVCSSEACQRRRRAEYHRRKIASDPSYRLIVGDSRKKWLEAHPNYMRSYRARRRRPNLRLAQKTLEQLVHLVKNNVALELKRCSAKVWLVCRDDESVKNTVARAQVIVIECISPKADV